MGGTGQNVSLEPIFQRVASEIDELFDMLLEVPSDSRAPLFEAMRHAVIGGGKRLRPLLLLAASDIFNVDRARALRAAAAVECIHCYSLIHDDLPCMDDDDLRRGKPTVHVAFDEATAVLAGDALHALAFELLASETTHPDPFVRSELISALAEASGPDGMAGGQAMDMQAEKGGLDLSTVTRLHQLKTGALISVSVEAGAILGHVPPEARTGLRGYAHDIGLAFQIADDILDAAGDEAAAGKPLRKDAEAGKQTFVTLLGIDRAREHGRMLIDQAVGHLHGYGEKADLLRAVARFVMERDR